MFLDTRFISVISLCSLCVLEMCLSKVEANKGAYNDREEYLNSLDDAGLDNFLDDELSDDDDDQVVDSVKKAMEGIFDFLGDRDGCFYHCPNGKLF